jgi:hypothetical protein
LWGNIRAQIIYCKFFVVTTDNTRLQMHGRLIVSFLQISLFRNIQFGRWVFCVQRQFNYPWF